MVNYTLLKHAEEIDGAYQRGLNDAWRVVSKIREYEEEKKAAEVWAGSEVTYKGCSFVVVSVSDAGKVCGITKDGKWAAAPMESVQKTGRYFRHVSKMLEEM